MADQNKMANARQKSELTPTRRTPRAEAIDLAAVNISPENLLLAQRALENPAEASPPVISTLQQTAGNRATSRFIQTKLTVGPAKDHYEQEADRVAEQVVSQPPVAKSNQPAVQRQAEEEEEVQTKPLSASITPLVQRQEVPEEEEIQTKSLLQRQPEEEEVQTKPLLQRQAEEEEEIQTKPLQRQPEEEEIQTKLLVQRQKAPEEEEIQTKPLLQRQEDEEEIQTKSLLQRQEVPEEEEIQTKPLLQRQADGSFEAGGEIENQLAASKGSGAPLPADTRAFMEPRFGTDFSGVRVHTGGESNHLNRQLSAQAFTRGQDIYLGEGRYDPGTTAGKRLLAHELTHVIQQGGAQTGRLQSKPIIQRIFGFGKKKEEPPPKTVDPRFFEESEKARIGGPQAMSPEFRMQKGEKVEYKETKIKILVAALSSQFKGRAGGFTLKRKAEVALKEQNGGELTPDQAAKIKELSELAPEELKKLGFLLPQEVAAIGDAKPKWHEKDEKAKEEWQKRLGKLPAKQQMQVNTYVTEHFEVSQERVVFLPRGETVKTGAPLSKEGVETPSKLPTEMFKRPAETKAPSSEDIVLKPSKTGEESVSHNVNAYRDTIAGYVREAGTDQGVVKQVSEMLMVDYVDVKQGAEKYNAMGANLKMTEEKIKTQNNPSTPKKEKEKTLKERDTIQKARTDLLDALHESDFDQATADAAVRAENAQNAMMATTQEKATIEYLYDEVEKKKSEITKRKSDATRAQKKDTNFNLQTAQMEKEAADAAKSQVQQAKLSFDVVKVKRKSAEAAKHHVQVKPINRFPGVLRGLLGKIVTGALGAGLNILTLGLVSLKGDTGVKGYMGEGLEKKGFPFKPTFLNDIRNQIAQFKMTLKARTGSIKGAKALDYVSAILRGFNEIVVQNVINIAGKLALVTGLLAMAATALAAGTLGLAAPVMAPVATVLGTISSIATFVALIAASVKMAVSLVRLTIDGLAALINSNAKLSNTLTSRAKQAGMETMADTAQLAGSALGPATGFAIKGNEFTNMFDPKQVLDVTLKELGAKHAIGTTIGATTASVSQSVGAPLVMGPIAQGIKGATDETYGLHTQHPDELGPRAPSKTRRGLLPPERLHNRLETRSQPNQTGNAPTTGMPSWMQAETEKQNKLRDETYKGRTATAVGQLTAVTTKSSELGGKLTHGKTESNKMDTILKQEQGKGNKEVDPEKVEMSQAQTGFLDTAGQVVNDTVLSLEQGKQDIQDLANQKQ